MASTVDNKAWQWQWRLWRQAASSYQVGRVGPAHLVELVHLRLKGTSEHFMSPSCCPTFAYTIFQIKLDSTCNIRRSGKQLHRNIFTVCHHHRMKYITYNCITYHSSRNHQHSVLLQHSFAQCEIELSSSA